MVSIRKKVVSTATGFTLVETVIVLALIGLTMTLLLSGSNSNTKIERFSGEVRTFADNLRQAQTHSYSIKTGLDSATCSQPVPPYNATSVGCIWRGDTMDFTPNSDYSESLLYGDDLSQFSANVVAGSSCTTNDPQLCLLGTQPYQTYTLYTKSHISIQTIKVDWTNSGVVPLPAVDTVSGVTIAFLAPDGKAFTGCNDVAATCNVVTVINPGIKVFNSQHPVQFTLVDPALSLKGIVTFDPSSGTINTSFQ